MLRSPNVGGDGIYWKDSALNKAEWKKRIEQCCEEAGTYQPCFDLVIDTVAEILERRDEAAELYSKMGGRLVIGYTNKGGARNPVKNPALAIWDELNRSALPYLRDLGLTPAGLKKISAASDLAAGQNLGDLLGRLEG